MNVFASNTIDGIVKQFTDGHAIRIYDFNGEYEPSLFARMGEEIYCYNKELGFFKYEGSIVKFKEHLHKMKREGFWCNTL